MKIKAFIKKFLQHSDPKKYEQSIRSLDFKRILAEDPICANDKRFDGTELVSTNLESTTLYTEMHKSLAIKYKLSEIATAEDDFNKSLQILNWVRLNTFYNGSPLYKVTDNSLDILKHSFGKKFKNAINCRSRAIVFSDCLVAIGIKAYPVCMQSAKFQNCHFTCRVYIKELKKWCLFDPSFGCWFSNKAGNPIDIFETRDLFLRNDEPTVNGYSFNGTTECLDVYMNLFLKNCISNLSTWRDNSGDRRKSKNYAYAKRFDAKLPN